MRRGLLVAAMLIAAFGTAATATATTITVTPTSLDGWSTTNFGLGSPPGSSSFVTGPGTPPLGGTGSWASESNPPSGSSGNRILQNTYPTTPLSSITEFSYWEQHTHAGGTTNTFSQPYFQAWVDVDANGTPDERLVFEPFLQQSPTVGGYAPKNGSHVVTTQNGITSAGVPDNVWYKWDLLNGAWYADGFDGATVGGPLDLLTFSGLITEFSGIQLVSGSSVSATNGIFQVQDGFNGYEDWTGHVDGVSITTTGGGNTTWDFEPDGPASVPEPSTFVLLAVGFLSASALRRRRPR